MLKGEVKIGSVYAMKVGNRVVPVRVELYRHWANRRKDTHWVGTNLQTGCSVRIKSAQKLRYEVERKESGKWGRKNGQVTEVFGCLPLPERDSKAFNERVTELRRKMPDDEPNTILARLHEGGEFLWADEAHVEGALLHIEELARVDHIGRVAMWLDMARSLGLTTREIAERISEAAGEMVAQAIHDNLLKDDAEWLADELAKARPHA